MSLFLEQLSTDFLVAGKRLDPEGLLLQYLNMDDVGDWIARESSFKKIAPYSVDTLAVIESTPKPRRKYVILSAHGRADGIPFFQVRDDLVEIIAAIDRRDPIAAVISSVARLPHLSRPCANLCAILAPAGHDKSTPRSQSEPTNGNLGKTPTDDAPGQSARSHTLLFDEVNVDFLLSLNPTQNQAAKIDTAIKIMNRRLTPVALFTAPRKSGRTTMANAAAGILSKALDTRVFRLKGAHIITQDLRPLLTAPEPAAVKDLSEIFHSLRARAGGKKPVVIIDDIDLALGTNVPGQAFDAASSALLSSPFGSRLLEFLARNTYAVGTHLERAATGSAGDLVRGSRGPSHAQAPGDGARLSLEAKIEEALARWCTKIAVGLVPPQDLSLIVRGSISLHEKISGRDLTFERGCDKSVANIVRPLGGRGPETAYKIIDQAIGVAVARGGRMVSTADVIEAASIITGASAQALEMTGLAHTRSIKELGVYLKSRIFGQDRAIETLENRLKVAMCGLNDDHKPLGSFMFVGPTGVGKTELAREASKYLGMSLTRIDMSEYSEEHSINKLIGSSPGYKESERGGVLSNAIRENPNTVILLDEAEKAHPLIHNLFLQMMDNGEFRDGMGGLVTCRSAMIIFTSNAGAASAATVKSLDARIGFGGGGDDPSTHEDYVKGMSRAIDDGMVRHFPPEFRNRLDAIVCFAPIQLDTARAVTRKLLDDLTRRVTLRHKVVVTFTDRLVEMITRRGYDVEYGARNIIRTIDTLVKTAIADQFAAAPHAEDAPRDLTLDADASDAVVVARREDLQDDDAWAGLKAG